WTVQVPTLLETPIYDAYMAAGTASEKNIWQSVLAGTLPPKSINSERAQFARAYYLAKKSNYPEALSILRSLSSPEAQALALQLNLQGGFIEDATKQIEQLKTSKASSSNKLQALVAVAEAMLAFVSNDAELSAQHLTEAEALDADNLNVGFLDSLLAQYNGDVKNASALVSELLYRYPSESVLRSRLAELFLAQGEREKAREEITQAKKLPYDQAYANLVDGYIELAERNIKAAELAFDRVITLDSSNAEAHLGLGLVAAAGGDLTLSQTHFKKAVHLSPQRSVFRSYLGKAFFEDDSEELAQNEYALAIELDPEDPTPYLYRAFTSLSQNKPVAALDDVEESIKRNDNRAVYRSRLLLDQDLGVRSASLARVFNDMGFSEVARLEAIKSINFDYFNYSAHRLLSESLVTIQDADASFSERRIADVLSPLSFNMFNSSGEQSSSNEYNALFDKDEERTSVFIGGETLADLYSTELLHAGKTGPFGYAFSYDALYGLGRKNDDYLRNNRFKSALQFQPTIDHKILLDGSYQYFELHDEEGSPIDSDTQSIDGSLAYVWKLSPRSTLIAEAKYNLDSDDSKDFDSRIVNISSQSESAGSLE
ncbi:MAG: hypothetical protein KDD62_11845, partial [Bdellovibrionales bacterium]|nr:hypothetical protein [Bdellovibrionales bacterium]